MRIWHISDTHGMEEKLIVPKNVDLVIHSGDHSNYRNPAQNAQESIKFLEWFNALDIKHKVLIPGNHDTALATGFINPENWPDITILIHDSTKIEGLNIFGSPYTPEFHHWAYNKSNYQLKELWEEIPENTDILITHGPPRGILDSCTNFEDDTIELVGDPALLEAVFKLNPRYHLFGHIHNNSVCLNQGIRVLGEITFCNGSCVTDRLFKKGPTSNGIILDIHK